MKRLFAAFVVLSATTASAQDGMTPEQMMAKLNGMQTAREAGQIIATAEVCGYELDAEKVSAFMTDTLAEMDQTARMSFQSAGGAQKIPPPRGSTMLSANKQPRNSLERICKAHAEGNAADADHAKRTHSDQAPALDVIRDRLHVPHVLLQGGNAGLDFADGTNNVIDPTMHLGAAFVGFVFRSLHLRLDAPDVLL